ncbi:hypothetical protein D515_04986 [Grimontia indica]|uniref:Uncharacterized protein n=1 Tax=Grimontia indica TaxID=1056512 RepID=R1IHV7_9GAMM|nr:hypothetical protein D515_04986 [Grimontia indica]
MYRRYHHHRRLDWRVHPRLRLLHDRPRRCRLHRYHLVHRCCRVFHHRWYRRQRSRSRACRRRCRHWRRCGFPSPDNRECRRRQSPGQG